MPLLDSARQGSRRSSVSSWQGCVARLAARIRRDTGLLMGEMGQTLADAEFMAALPKPLFNWGRIQANI
ncbi:MAG: hypothetical protein ACKN9T_13125 [Candidatus Methylumidiphilus sp.]